MKNIEDIRMCGNCKYWQPPQEEEKEYGQCRRNPPALMWILDDEDSPPSSAWPPASEGEWCGEFAPKNTRGKKGAAAEITPPALRKDSKQENN